jgi:hypothetical protein
MTFKKTAIASSISLLLAASAGLANAKATDAEVARLGKDLTPLGGEMAGNKDGTIPAYTGGLTKPPACFKPGVEYCDPFTGEKPKFEITAANAEQYKDKLPPGALALLKKFSTFKIPVYTTHRTGAVPPAVADVVKAEATKIDTNGFGITNRVASTTPFPIPKNGLEAIWNHNLRYMGGGLIREQSHFPVRANGDTYKITTKETRIFNQNLDTPQANLSFVYNNYFISPANLVGTVFLVHEPVDQVAEARSAWIYNAGQRRVRRAPDLGYDAVNDGTEGLRFTDQVDGYNGAPDRFDWKLLGKKEMYVPYNAYHLGEKKVKYADIIQKSHPNPELIRYELHRVWVVEATLKPTSKHSYGKRVFLLDEDTWNVLWEDAYDSRGNLWRVGVHPFVQYYDAGVPSARANIWHDLTNSAYLMSGLDNESDGTVKFGQKARLKDFQPDALRRIGN